MQRLRAPVWRDWPAPLDQVRDAGARAERAMYLRYRIIAHELRECGIDSNCAPLVDVARNDTHPFLRNRCYGDTAPEVSRIGRVVAQGHLDGGVLPVLKHIPGHGRAMSDSHVDLPRVSCAMSALQSVDFVPFQELNDLPMGMTAHVVFEALDPSPATLSPAVIGLIRDEIGFDGLLMTDDIAMKALRGELRNLSEQSIRAGCDVVLHCNGTPEEQARVVAGAGRMSDAAQARAERALARRKTPDAIDISVLDAEFEALLKGASHG